MISTLFTFPIQWFQKQPDLSSPVWECTHMTFVTTYTYIQSFLANLQFYQYK